MLPKVLVLDEPTSDLDPVGTREVLNVLHLLNKQYGMTILLIEHKIDEIVPWVDRVLLKQAEPLPPSGPLWHRESLALVLKTRRTLP